MTVQESKKSRGRGRPTRLTEATEAAILAGLREGKVMGEICSAGAMPSRELVQAWMAERPNFRAKVQRARELGADAMAERALQIADETPPVSGEVARARLRADVRLKLAAAWNATYSNRPQVQVTHEPPRIDFGLSPEKMVYLVRAVEAALGSDVVDVTPLRLAAPVQRKKDRQGS